MRPRASTNLQRAIRRELHRRGRRFRINYPALPGWPDLAFTRAKVAVFVDDCFWHRCPQHCTTPDVDRAWWLGKLERTVARDRERDAQLAALGWSVIRVWEHEPAMETADRIEAEWQERIGLLRPRGATARAGTDADDELDEDDDDLENDSDEDGEDENDSDEGDEDYLVHSGDDR
jgi:DNA mismatch endonuclease (patch repair protein)